MKHSGIFAAAVFCAALLAGSATATAAGLGADEFKQELVGKTITWHGEKNPSVGGKAVFTNDGVQKIFDLKGIKGMTEDTGKWWFEGNKICNQFKKIRKGKKACQDVTSLGGGKYRMGSSILQK
ncbi:hypothetical protein [Stappia sp.]|uniref:hypothetical protein n=1 Tax=Stappia sp. TaxID=1870903 RepID=UPI003A99F392